MQIFDRIDPLALENRQWHLWLLALTVLSVFGIGLVLLMYPLVFSTSGALRGMISRNAFLAFCVLVVLLMGYLVERQVVISRLRKRLAEDQSMIIRLRHQASTDLLATLPDVNHFRDRLAMEYRRAATTGQPLSLVVVALTAASQPAEDLSGTYADAARALIRKLREGDSIYLFSRDVFCIVLPGLEAQGAQVIAKRLDEAVQGASGAGSRFSFEIHVFNYPEDAKSARELEEAVRPFAPRKLTEQAAVGASLASG